MDSILAFLLLGSFLTLLLSFKYIYQAIISRDFGELFLLLVFLPIFNWVSFLLMCIIISDDILTYIDNYKKSKKE